MKTAWLIECSGDLPTVYICAEGGLTYKPLKAKRYSTKEEAEKRIQGLQLADTWKAVAHNVVPNER